MTYAELETSRYEGSPVFLYRFEGADPSTLGPYCYTSAEEAITRAGEVYQPWPISHGDVSYSDTLDNTMLDVSLARGTDLDDLFIAYPPGQTVNLFVISGHAGVDPATYRVIWSGRVLGFMIETNTVKFNCEPVATSMRRPGLRRNYQIGCPHVLYGNDCGASKANATFTRTVTAVSGQEVTLGSALPGVSGHFVGGLFEWVRPDGVREVRSIIGMSGMSTVRVRGRLRGIEAGTSVDAIHGCNHRMDHCENLHQNIQNFGGQPWIPLDNPLVFQNKFY